MKEIFLLTKILLKSSTNDGEQKRNRKTNGVGKFVILFLAYGYIIGFMSVLSYTAISGLIFVNKPELFWEIALLMILGFGVIQTVITSINILYFSKDLDFLLPLPITPQKVIIAKMNCLVISQYILITFLVMPGLFIYGKLLNLGMTYYIISIISLLLFPLIPVAVISFLITIVMKYTKIIKNKEVLQYITVILTLILIILLSGMSGKITNAEELTNTIIQSNGIIEGFSKIIPTIDLTMKSILNCNNINGIINTFISMVISIGVYYITAKIISKVYVKTVISIITVKRKANKQIKNIKNLKMNNVFGAYLKKEFKLLVRNPIFFMQCVLPSIIFPIIITIPMIIELKNTTTDMVLLQSEFSNMINTNFGFMCLMVAILVFFMFNHTSITSISREGQNAVFMKYIPISYEKQLVYKIMPGILLNILPIIYVLLFAIICIPGIKIKTILYTIVISSLINILNNILMIIVDLKNPKLKWITEQAVVKQNFNMFFSMAFIGIETVAIFLIGMFLLDLDYLAIILMAIFVSIIILLGIYIKNNSKEIFNKII